MLSTENLSKEKVGTNKKKLGPRWIGPFEIIGQISDDYYELKLNPKLKLYPVFHTSLLKPSIQEPRENLRKFQVLLPDGTVGELIESVISEKKKNGKIFYKVKWVGQQDHTWEPEENLAYVPGLIQEYQDKKRRKIHRRRTSLPRGNVTEQDSKFRNKVRKPEQYN